MATRYGYKLFTVELYRENGRKKLDYSTAKLKGIETSFSFLKSLDDVCTDLLGRRFIGNLSLREELHLDEDEATDTTGENKPYISLEEWSRDKNTYSFVVRSGVTGSHDMANGLTEDEDVSLEDRAPSNPFRAFLYIPKKGEKAALGVEARGSYAPGLNLMKLLTVGGKTIDEERAEADRRSWWRYSVKQITDPETVDQYVLNGAAQGVRFTRYSSTSQGTRRTKDVVLTQHGLPANGIQAAAAVARAWRKANKDGSKLPTGNQVAHSLSQFLEVDIDHNEFDEAALEWKSPDGTVTYVSPESFKDKFTYRMNKPLQRPTAKELRNAIEYRLTGLSKVQKLNLDL